MFMKRSRAATHAAVIEGLESRQFLSASLRATPFCVSATSSAPAASPVAVAASVRADAATVKTVTTLTLSKHATTLGSPIVLLVSVRAVGQKAKPTGTVTITDSGANLAGQDSPLTLTLSAGKSGYFLGAGDLALTTGTHRLQATYTSASTLPTSVSPIVTAKVSMGKFKTASDGLETRIAQRGKGPAIKAGQTAHLFYTGYLASTGTVFDYSAAHPPVQPLTFVIGSGQVIPGFDEGVLGMRAGETRYIFIPSALGYGASGGGSLIPPNSDLIFLVQLVSIS